MPENHKDIHQLERAFDELRLVNRVLDKICRIRESNHVMDVFAGELVKLSGADQGVISLISPMDEDDLQTVVRRERKDVDTLPGSISRLVAGWVLRQRRMLCIDDLDHCPEIPGLSSNEGRFKSVLCPPMIVRDEPIGVVMMVRGQDRGPFTEDEARLSGILASQSAQILANARLFEELTQKNRLLAAAEQKLKEENARLQSEVGATFSFENIVAKSRAMKRVLTLMSKFTSMDAPVLVTGETGTGKELVARAIHYNSPRKQKPFVVKNCGVKTETLLESELFGHVKGAFTGAVRDRRGLFEEADGGTIFLDEIGDAPASTQAAILRVIQTGEIRPVGDTRTRTVDVRVLSATNRNLKEEIEAGRFREDLYYRISTFAIELPALRERADDIPHLVRHTLGRLKLVVGRDELSVTPEALDRLVKYPWPGNVRQLENELERAAVVCDIDGRIDIEHLSPELRTWSASDPSLPAYRGQLREIVERVERDAIRAALAEQHGNILQTAKELGLTRKGLKDKMTRYGIRADAYAVRKDSPGEGP